MTAALHRMPVPAVPPTPAQRVAGLQAEARDLALQEVADFTAAVRALADSARTIADGGDAYPVGAREVARRLTGTLAAEVLTLTALAERGR